MLNEVISSIEKAVTAAAKVRVNFFEDEKFDSKVTFCVNQIMKSIAVINNLDKYTVIIDGVIVDDIEIPSDFIDFVMPKSISVDPTNEEAIDFKLRQPIDFEFSIETLNRAVTMYLNLMRQNRNESLVKIGTKRTHVSLFDVYDKCAIYHCYDEDEMKELGADCNCSAITYVCYDKEYFVPILIDTNIRLYHNEHYNMKYMTMVNRYITRKFN